MENKKILYKGAAKKQNLMNTFLLMKPNMNIFPRMHKYQIICGEWCQHNQSQSDLFQSTPNITKMWKVVV